MNKQDVKKLALECGFKLKEQPDGSMDLNPYVYKFAEGLVLKREILCWGSLKKCYQSILQTLRLLLKIIKNLNYEVKQWVKLTVELH